MHVQAIPDGPSDVDEPARIAAILRYWEYVERDTDVAHELYREDAILEFPQSGERDEKVARESIYVTEAWEAPEWRAPWRAKESERAKESG